MGTTVSVKVDLHGLEKNVVLKRSNAGRLP